MKMTNRLLLCCATLLLLAAPASPQKGGKEKTFNTSGVFSNIEVGPGGDYGGMEVYLTDSDGQFYVTVTVAEGVLLPPVLVKAQVDVETRKVEFTLPGEGGGRKFAGAVAADGLTLTEGGEKHFLKRKCYQ